MVDRGLILILTRMLRKSRRCASPERLVPVLSLAFFGGNYATRRGAAVFRARVPGRTCTTRPFFHIARGTLVSIARCRAIFAARRSDRAAATGNGVSESGRFMESAAEDESERPNYRTRSTHPQAWHKSSGSFPIRVCSVE